MSLTKMAESLRDKTARGLFWGALNNGGMQILNIVFAIVVARKLNPGDYGLTAMLTVYSYIASNLQESGFINALINRRNASHDDFNSVFWFNVTVSVVMYIVLWFCAPLIAEYNHQPILVPLSHFVFLGIILSSFAVVPRAKMMKEMRQKELAAISILALVASGTTGIIMAVNGMAFWGIATQQLVNIGMVSLLSWWFVRWRPSLAFSFTPIKEMFGFSCKILITNIVNNINRFAFETFLGKFYPKYDVGQYSQANSWNMKGTLLINGIVQGVAQPMFVSIKEESTNSADERERLKRALRKMVRFTAFISFPAMFGLILVAPEFIHVTITDKYADAARLMQILCLGGAFVPIITIFQHLIISRGKSGIYMWCMIAQVALILLDLFCVQHFQLSLWGVEGIKLMVMVYVGIIMLWTLVWHFFVWREIRLSLLNYLADIVPFMSIALLSMLATYFITLSVSNPMILLCLRIVFAATIYIGILWILKAKILRECMSYFRKKT